MKEKIRKKIEKHINEFDLCALLQLLKMHGIRHEEIYFLCNNTQVSHAHLCHAIEFRNEHPKVRITLNMGLLGANSTIPSFMQSWIDTEEVNSNQFLRYLNFFNHHLMDRFVQLSMPELNDSFFLNWRETRHKYLSMLGFDSVGTLWFLMKLCFPDLVIEVKKNPQTVKLHTSSLILGRDSLGPTAFLGTRFRQTLSSFKIILSTEDEMSDMGVPWPIEINHRFMEMIYPVLKKTDLHLSVVLRIKNKVNFIRLGPKTHLGFERMWKSKAPFELLIYYGLIKNMRRNAYLPG